MARSAPRAHSWARHCNGFARAIEDSGKGRIARFGAEIRARPISLQRQFANAADRFEQVLVDRPYDGPALVVQRRGFYRLACIRSDTLIPTEQDRCPDLRYADLQRHSPVPSAAAKIIESPLHDLKILPAARAATMSGEMVNAGLPTARRNFPAACPSEESGRDLTAGSSVIAVSIDSGKCRGRNAR